MRRRGWLDAAGDLLFGALCPACDRPSWGICETCRRAVSGRSCYLTQPDPCPPGFPRTATATPYDSVAKSLISAHKERHALTLTPFLAQRLAAAISLLLSDPALFSDPAMPAAGLQVTLVPVPSSPAAVRARGNDATWAMARQAAGMLRPRHQTAVVRLLTSSRRIKDQAGLSALARRDNLAGAFRVTGARRPVVGVVIVDDVVTTGASLTEATRALKEAGVQVLGAATVAATVRSRPRR